jgi:3-hydroxyisobutyrate dehydrogenase-like beta-hydroxyacid dehydrogenase
VKTSVGVLHPGAMGAAVGAVLVDQGLPTRWLSAGRGPATRRRAEEAGLTEAADLAGCDVVLSICPPASAVDVAREVAASGFAGVYLDANAISPGHAREIESLFGGRASVVDGGIVGPPPKNDGSTRLYLSGKDAQRVADLFAGTFLRPIVLDGPVGQASALKLAFASYNKLTYALAAQAHALAAHHGVDDAFRELAGAVRRDTPLGAPGALESAGQRAWRWEGEMAEIADACAGAGLSPALVTAAQELFGRWREHRDDEGVTAGELLAALAVTPDVVTEPG